MDFIGPSKPAQACPIYTWTCPTYGWSRTDCTQFMDNSNTWSLDDSQPVFRIHQTLEGSQKVFPGGNRYLSKRTLFHSQMPETYAEILFLELNISLINNSNPHRHFEYHICCVKKLRAKMNRRCFHTGCKWVVVDHSNLIYRFIDSEWASL